jgi:hypothetical protein
MDLSDAHVASPARPRRRGLTVSVALAGFVLSIPILAIAAVAGFARGWRGVPRVLQGENIIDPFVHLGGALLGAALFTLIAMGAIASVAVLGFLVHHRRHRTPDRPTSPGTEHDGDASQSDARKVMDAPGDA